MIKRKYASVFTVMTFSILLSGGLFPFMEAQAGALVNPACEAMYGSGGANGADPGSIFLVSQTDGSQTLIGDPTINGGLSGIAFDDQANLWGSNVNLPVDDSHLLQINPFDGSLINDVGSILDPAGNEEKVQDLAYRSSTDQLFGTTDNGDLVIIDRTNAVATVVGQLPADPMHIGFAPDGTLYAVDRNFNGDLFTLDPTNANVLTQVVRSPDGELDALGVDPSTGIIWVSETTFDGLGPQVLTIDSAGNRVVVGSGVREVADLDFLPCLVVGGEFLPIDSTALILAGAQTNAVWLMSALAVIGSVAFGALYITSKKN